MAKINNLRPCQALGKQKTEFMLSLSIVRNNLLPFAKVAICGLLGLGLAWTPRATAQVLFNEVCSDNQSILQDQDGDYSDWIELYNSGSSSLDLQGYRISDQADISEAWVFPSLDLPPQSYGLLFASSKDRQSGELHSDFKISKEGEALYLWDASGALVEEIVLPAISSDYSYGRKAGSPDEWFFLFDPSPEQANTGDCSAVPQIPQLLTTNFFQAAPFDLELGCAQADCVIRYTTDGAFPSDTSLVYTGPIRINRTTTIRCAGFLPTGLHSETVTRTYFVDSPHSLAIVNLTISPEILFDEETGIFLRGPNAEPEFPFYGANYWSEQEEQAYLEFFSKDRSLEVEFPIGAKIHGGTVARTRSQKPVRLVARDSFGPNKVVHAFFDEKEVNTFKRLILRNSSGDFLVGNMRDGFIQRHCQRQGLNIDMQGFRPLAYYVNGEYWGIIFLREKVDEHYIRYNFDVEIDQLDLLEQDSFVLEGNFAHFDSMELYAHANDLSQEINFDLIRANFDLESMSDYFIVQTLINNSDWPKNNLKLWRERKAGAKWRYLLFDLDAAMGRFGWTSINADGWGRMMGKTDVRHVRLLQAFLTNERFRFYFLNRYADLLNTSFHPDVFQEEIYSTAAELNFEMERHMKRWGGNFEFWQQEEIPRFLEYAAERPPYARQFLIDYFALPGEVPLRFNTYPAGAGTIVVNSLAAQAAPWEGIYFQGVPVTVSIVPNPGYTFSHWQSLHTINSPDANTSIQYAFQQSDELTAFFTETSESHELQISPNPSSDYLKLSFVLSEAAEVQGALYDTQGRLLLRSPAVLRNAGAQEIDLMLSELPAGVYFVRLLGGEEISSVRLVKL